MQYFYGPVTQKTPNSSLADTTPPTFAGITAATPNNNGSITVEWGSVTESASLPVEYNIYVAEGSVDASALFVTGNLVAVSPVSGRRVYTLADQSTYLAAGQTYTFGVRAKDAVGNINQNTALETAVSTGVLSDGLAEYVQLLSLETLRVKSAAVMVLAAAD